MVSFMLRISLFKIIWTTRSGELGVAVIFHDHFDALHRGQPVLDLILETLPGNPG